MVLRGRKSILPVAQSIFRSRIVETGIRAATLLFHVVVVFCLTVIISGSVSSAAPTGDAQSKGDSSAAKSAKAQNTSASAPAGKNAMLGKDAFGTIDQKAPLLIKSKSLDLNSKERTFTYRDEVEVQKGDLVITADLVIGTYTEKNEIQKIVCQNNVVITRGETLRASSNRAVYFVDRDVIEMTEGPDLIHDGSALSADKITFYVAEDRSEAEGNVRVKVVGVDDLKAGQK